MSDIDALVARLRDRRNLQAPLCTEAADALEAMRAETERLRERAEAAEQRLAFLHEFAQRLFPEGDHG